MKTPASTARASTAPAARQIRPVAAALFMLASCACFAMNSVTVRYVSADLHPFEIAFFRNLFAAAIIVPLAVRSSMVAFLLSPPAAISTILVPGNAGTGSGTTARDQDLYEPETNQFPGRMPAASTVPSCVRNTVSSSAATAWTSSAAGPGTTC